MYEIKADTEKNRLIITLTGQMDKKNAETAQQILISEVGKLKPGFVVINDISGLSCSHVPALAILKDISLFLRAQQAGKIIRIVGQAKTGKTQFDRATQNLDSYEPIIVESMQDAEELLKQPSNSAD